MFTMDFKCKGITWVGNIYEKFEAICLEAEDLGQDTAKYVENQVQNVGGNIRKFCAEVMHDLIPPSSENPDKEVDSDIAVEQNAEFRTCKKPKLDAKDKPRKENVPHKLLEAIAPAMKDSSLVSFLSGVPKINHLIPLASVGPAKDADLDFSLELNDDVYNPKKSKKCTEDDPMGEDSTQVKEKDHTRPPASAYPVMVSGLESSQELDEYVGKCRKSSVHIGGESMLSGLRSENHEMACATLKKMLAQNPFEVTVDNSPERVENLDSYILRQSGRAADIHPVVICENKAMEIGVTPSSSILSTEPNVIETLTTFKAMMESSMEPSMDRYELYDNDAELEAFMTPPPEFGRSDDDGVEVEAVDFGVEVVAADDGVEVEAAGDAVVLKTIEQFDNVKLDDSCIVVQPFTVSCRERRHRSYKKKIQDAFASRMGSSKTKEYEQLAIWCADIDAGTNQQSVEVSTPATLSRKMDSMSLSTDEFCESGWEIV